MNIEQIVRRKRNLEYAVRRQDVEAKVLLSELINEYNNSLEKCDHDCYLDYGYYKCHNNDIYKTNKEEAEFRTIICPTCGKQVNLLKTDDFNWDKTINGKNVQVISVFEINSLPSKILEEEIENIMINYYNLNQKYCGHLEFDNKGYYIINDGHIIKGDYNNSDFRIVTCKKCKKTMLLPKTDCKYWNSTIEENPITVTKIKKINV